MTCSACVRRIDAALRRVDGVCSIDANLAEGRVIGVSHLGETMQYLVQLGSDLSVISRRPTPDAPRLAVGDVAWCSWRAESVQVFAADDAATAAGFVEPPTA
jgi:spermidine/putrescine transport system ATP-binding protein